MTECAVASCSSDSIKHPNKTFFSLPQEVDIRRQWFEVLGLKKTYEWSEQTKICEEHFRPEDFCEDKTQLKSQTIPVNLDFPDDMDSIENDNISMDCDESSATKIKESRVELKSETKEDSVEIKPEVEEMETISNRRPSRRAAQLAAKKIYDSVHSFNVLSGETSLSSLGSRKIHPSPNDIKYKRSIKDWHALKVRPEEIGVLLECHEELLSLVQKEAFAKATKEYNIAESALRILKSMNVRIIKMDKVDPKLPILNPITIINEYSAKNTNPPSMQKQNSITMTPIESPSLSSVKVFPIKLSPTIVSLKSPGPILS